METRENRLKELREIAPTLAKMEKKNFYSVPENYFVNFKSGILEQVKLSGVKEELKAIAPELLKVEKKAVAEIPANYFQSFSGDLLKKIRANEVATELQTIAPTLSELEKVNLLEVPANYFSAFPQQMMKRIAAEQKVKEVSVMPKWMEALNSVLENISAVVFKPKYSLAFAGTTAVLIVGLMFFTQQVQEQCADLDCKMAQLSDEELNAYLEDDTYTSSEEIFELNSEVSLPSTDYTTNAFNNLTDEELNNAILD